MINNYFLLAFRNLLKHKNFSAINIFGLSVSMAVCMLIILVVQDQLSYDRFHKNLDQIFRVQSKDNLSKISFNKYATTTWPLAKELKDNYPFVRDVVSLNTSFNGEGICDERRFQVSGFFATPSFFNLFDFKLKNNPKSNPLDEPFTIVLTEDVAKKFFGASDPVGKVIIFESYGNLKVTGVIPKMKQKSHIQFEALVSEATLLALEKENKIHKISDNWEEFVSSFVYIMLNENARQSDLDTALVKISKLKYPENGRVNLSLYSTPLSKIVPGPMLANENGMFMPTGDCNHAVGCFQLYQPFNSQVPDEGKGIWDTKILWSIKRSADLTDSYRGSYSCSHLTSHCLINSSATCSCILRNEIHDASQDRPSSKYNKFSGLLHLRSNYRVMRRYYSGSIRIISESCERV